MPGAQLRGTPRLDIVIPARAEPTLGLSRCLESLLAERQGLDLRVIVVANGPGAEDTVAAACRFSDAFEGGLVVRKSAAGKAAALNVGDGDARGGPIAYLDADVALLEGTLVAMIEALDSDFPRFAAPMRRLVPGRSAWTRAFARVWQALPSVGEDVGSGCYGVNAAGRRRWGAFPPVLADDAFVRTRFLPAERRIVPAGGAMVALPEGLDLVRAVRRWRSGNQQLREQFGPSSDLRGGFRGNVSWVTARPQLWASLPAFAAITAAARLAPEPRSDWQPPRTRDREAHAAEVPFGSRTETR